VNDKDLTARAFQCPLCKSRTYRAVPLPPLQTVRLALYQCDGCTLTFVNPGRFAKESSGQVPALEMALIPEVFT